MGRSDSLLALVVLAVLVALPVLLLLLVVGVVVPMAVWPLRPRWGGCADYGPARGGGSWQGGHREGGR